VRAFGVTLALAVVLGTNAFAKSECPVCTRVGTRSEGWAWPDGRFIRWAKCKGVVPKCHTADARHKVEGWYAGRALITRALCPTGGPPRP
jgi:hypothetical protein